MCSTESWHSHIHREQLISRVWPKSLMLLKYKCYHVADEYRERKESCIADQLHFHYYIFFPEGKCQCSLCARHSGQYNDHVALVSNILSHAY